MIVIVKTEDMNKEEFKCQNLQELNEITRIKDSFKHYLHAFPRDKVKKKIGDNFVFVIRIPGATVGCIEVTKDLKIVDAEYYQGEYNQKLFDKKDLEKCNKVLKKWIGKSIILLKETKDIENFFKED